MTATIPQSDVLERLDFDPSCQAPACRHGNPIATHLVVNFCDCPPWPVCEGCAVDLSYYLATRRITCCQACRRVTFTAHVRIEPLP